MNELYIYTYIFDVCVVWELTLKVVNKFQKCFRVDVYKIEKSWDTNILFFKLLNYLCFLKFLEIKTLLHHLSPY